MSRKRFVNSFRRRTFHEPNLIQIKADPNQQNLACSVDSDAERRRSAEPNLILW